MYFDNPNKIFSPLHVSEFRKSFVTNLIHKKICQKKKKKRSITEDKKKSDHYKKITNQ